MDSFEVDQLVRSELMRDEKLIWSGNPRQGIVLRPQDVLMIPFSLMWAGFAFFWEFGVITSGAPLFFRLWGIPFVLVGVYIVVGRFFWDSWIRSRTGYGLTDRRILIVTNGLSRKVQSLALRALPDVSVSRRGDAGTITFGQTGLASWASGSGWPGYGRQVVPAFDLASDVQRVYELILSAQSDAEPEPKLPDIPGAPLLPEPPTTEQDEFWSRG